VEEDAALSETQEERNKVLVRRFLEAQAKGDLDAVKEMMAPHFVDHHPRNQGPDHREGYLRVVAEEQGAFSDIRYIIEDQIAEDDKVMTRWTGSGLHDRGEYQGFAPTGRWSAGKIIDVHRIERGKIAEEWKGASTLAALQHERLAQVERERIEQELRVARRIQQASLPKEVPTLEGWQISPLYQPAREVGGDFFDFHLLSGGSLGLVVGDATGKGVPAALVMSTTCGMLRAVSQASDSASPGQMLERVNEALVPSIPDNMFVTCFCAILDPKKGSLRYANAGHDLPYLHRNGTAEELRARGMPLGLMPGMEYEEKEIVLQEGDSALLYTDGLVEAHDPQREMFGFPRLQALESEHGEEERSLEEALLEELHSFVGEGWEQEDDITLLTLRRSASPN
jgi:serine phosphatase RsbU (regulator of sigma subunit)